MSTVGAEVDDDLGPLFRLVRGRVVDSRDADWPRQRLGWNVAVAAEPRAVVHVSDAADIQAVVRFAAERDIAVTAQPSGHGVSRELCGTIVLRTAALQELTIDTDRRVARVGAGVKWQQLNEALTGTGLTGLPGSTGDVSVVGYCSGGGLSWFGRKYGLAANRLRAIDLVDARGDLIRVTAGSDPDLWWALRGGGGDFGIITAVEIDLLPLDQLYGGRLLWGGEHTAAVLHGFAELTRDVPEELTTWAWMLNLPDLPFIPEPLRGRRAVALDITYLGPGTEADELLAPVLQLLPAPLLDTRGPKPLAELAAIAAEPVDPTPIVEHTAMLSGFDHDVVDGLMDGLDLDRPSLLTFVHFRHLGGALRRPVADGGAAGAVPQPYVLFAGAVAPNPDVAVAAEAELVGLLATLADVNTGVAMINMGPLADGNYSARTLARLWDIKRRVDPLGTIRSCRPVPAPQEDPVP